MKKVFTLFIFLSLAFSTTTFAQVFSDYCVKAEISYQIVTEVPGELVLDIYLKEHSSSPCGPTYLGQTDVVFSYSAGAFTATPTITKVDQIVDIIPGVLTANKGYCEFTPVSSSGAAADWLMQETYHSNIGSEELNGQLIINLNAPSPLDQSALDTKTAHITTTRVRLGRFTISNYSGVGHGLTFVFPSTTPLVQQAESKTFSFEPTTPYTSWRVELSEEVLPIDLKKFTAVAANSTDALVKWETALEQNVSHFELQRSASGDTWATITEQNAQGQGAYTYNDINVYRGTTKETFYYRLRTIDVSGAAQISEVKAVTFIGRDIEGDVVLSPNPAQNSVTLGLYKAENLDDVTYQITNVHGQLVQEGRILGQETTINFELESGIYFIRLMKDGVEAFTTQKMIVTNQ